MAAELKGVHAVGRRNLQFYLDIATCTFVFFLFSFFRPDFVLLAVWVLMWPYIFISRRKKLLVYFLLSNIIGIGWFILSKNNIHYVRGFLSFRGHQFFVLFGWSLGLVFFKMICDSLKRIFHFTSYLSEYLFFSVLFIAVLLAAESIGYHFFNITNELAVGTAGLPVLDCIHGPAWIKIGYCLTGPLYLILTGVFYAFKRREVSA